MTRYRLRWALLVIYLLLLVGVVAALLQARRYAMKTYGTPAAQADWEAWVADVKKQQEGDAPVQRRVPRSQQPPALVLMKDHFLTCLVGALLLTTALYGTIAGLLYGALTSPAQPSAGAEGETKINPP